ncbi:MAG: hypothetical protein KIG51_10145 [Fibrobacter sp.]|nr:hypothetical protein [Fibrobacter sp.]
MQFLKYAIIFCLVCAHSIFATETEKGGGILGDLFSVETDEAIYRKNILRVQRSFYCKAILMKKR